MEVGEEGGEREGTAPIYPNPSLLYSHVTFRPMIFRLSSFLHRIWLVALYLPLLARSQVQEHSA